jgi:hypothetical protein
MVLKSEDLVRCILNLILKEKSRDLAQLALLLQVVIWSKCDLLTIEECSHLKTLSFYLFYHHSTKTPF